MNYNQLNCSLCNKRLSSRESVIIRNAPDRAQNFSLKKNKNKINLKLVECSNCNLVQLKNNPVNYYKETIRSVGFSKEILRFREKQFKNFIIKNKLKNKKIIEVGSANGDYLKILSKFCKKSYGLEYKKENINICKQNKLKIIKGFIGNEKYKIPKKPFDAFFIFSYLEHIPHINNFLQGLKNNLNKNAVGIVEVPNFNMIIKKRLFTELIIDHLYYFTKETFQKILEINGFKVLRIKSIWKNYILSAEIIKKNIKNINYQDQFKIIKKNFKKIIKNNKKIAVWGAGHQSLTTLSIANINKNISYIVDSATFKQNKYAPGTNIIIKNPKYYYQDKKIDNIIVLGGSYDSEIVSLIKKNKKKQKIYILKNNKIKKL